MRMRPLKSKDDPSGFLNLFRLASMDRFGDPSGFIQGHGRYGNHTKRGPGRRNVVGADDNARQRATDRIDTESRNPFVIERRHNAMFIRGYRDEVTLGPVRMKLPRLRRCTR